ncbi:MAG: GIY-YIG nuclease family protein, partial [Angelakisella sp.]
MNEEKLAELRQKTLTLPQEPGVYRMRGKAGEIIYIGKAKSLKNRVSSYFRSVDKHQLKVYRMVENVWDFDYIVTDSEFEALVLECSLIKLHRPKYNILLKDDKGYSYIKISKGDYGRITAEKVKTEGDGVYLGPYMSGLVVK